MSDLETRVRDALDGRYEIVRELGAGGMAVVFLANDVKHARQVAMKVLRPEIAVSMGAERFASEILSVAQLTHPHILPLYDSGDADGLLYYVMPLVEGESLKERLDRDGSLPELEAVRIASEVADGLHYAHQRGMLHRDIKPANIMLSGGHALIADFGLARLIDRAQSQGLTQTGTVVGTPVYMSPEQFTAPDELDGRGDLYSLSCVTYEMLTGEPPYQHDSVFGFMASHTAGEIPSVQVARPDVSDRVGTALLRGLAKDPADRFATTTEFALALTGGDAVALPARPTAPGRPLPRRRLIAVAGGVAVVAALLSVATFFRGDGGSDVGGTAGAGLDDMRVVVASLENGSGREDLSSLGDVSADWITQGLHRTGIIDVIASPTARQVSRFVAQGMLDGSIVDPVQAVAQETGAGIVISGRFYTLGDSLYFQVEVTNAARGELLDAVGPIGGLSDAPLDVVELLRGQVMGSLAVNLDERLARSRESSVAPPTFAAYQAFNRGLDAYIDSDWVGAVAGFEEAWQVDATFPVPMIYAALSYSNLGRFVEADEALARISESRQSLSNYHRYWLEHVEAMFRGERDRAFEAIRRASDLSPGSKASYNAAWTAVITRRPNAALELLDRLDPHRGPMRGWVHWWIQRAHALHLLQRYEEELEVAREARTLYPDFLDLLRVEGSALVGLGRIEEALAVAEEALQMEPRVNTPGVTALGIADELEWHGAPSEAEALIRRAIAWYEARPPAQLESNTMAEEYGQALMRVGRTDEAIIVWEGLRARNPDRWFYQLAPGVVAAEAGDVDRAMEADARLAGIEDPHARGSNTRMRAAIATYLGREEEAVRLLQQSYEEGFLYGRHLESQYLRLIDRPEVRELATLIRDR